MKTLRFLAVAMLCAMVSIHIKLEAGFCGKGKVWANNACRKKCRDNESRDKNGICRKNSGQGIEAQIAPAQDQISHSTINVTVINLPADNYVAAKVKSGNSVQTPIDGKNLYTFYPNTIYYTIKRVNRQDTITSQQHPQSDFVGKTTWDLSTDTISAPLAQQTPGRNPVTYDPQQNATSISTTFYNDSARDISIQTLINGVKSGDPVIIDSTKNPLSSGVVIVTPSDPTSQISYLVSVPTFAAGHTTTISINPIVHPFEYQITATADDQQIQVFPVIFTPAHDGTYEPRQIFGPSGQFANQGLVGVYFSSNQVAIINDPRLANPTNYIFNNVIQGTPDSWIKNGNIELPEGMVEFGQFMQDSPCSSTTCPGDFTIVKFYGNLVPQTPPAQSIIQNNARNQVIIDKWAIDNTPPTPALGSNPGTYAPQTFTPSDQFAGKNLVGNYFSNSQTATIHDPTQANPISYTFDNVSQGGIQQPQGMVKIGSFTKVPNCSGTQACPMYVAVINLYGTLVSQTPPAQQAAAPGSNPGTYAPQTFTPSDQFAGKNLVGNYFSSSQVATIHDPTQTNPTSYTFNQVQSSSSMARPMGLTLIGTFPTPNWKPSKMYCSGCPTGTTSLWGNLVPQNSAQ